VDYGTDTQKDPGKKTMLARAGRIQSHGFAIYFLLDGSFVLVMMMMIRERLRSGRIENCIIMTCASPTFPRFPFPTSHIEFILDAYQHHL
jgi:hypothetical protein